MDSLEPKQSLDYKPVAPIGLYTLYTLYILTTTTHAVSPE